LRKSEEFSAKIRWLSVNNSTHNCRKQTLGLQHYYNTV